MVASVAKVGKLHGGGSPGVGLDYYLHYVERGGEPGRWLGGGAGELGLEGQVRAPDLLSVGQGRAPGPEGAILGRRREGRVPAWDITFSAPKSVSVLHGLADGEARQLLRDAHDRAVEAAVGWLEASAGRARRGSAGADGHVPVRLVVAAFVHGTSRALDPDLHTHCLVANLGLDATGRWSSIDSRVIYRHKMAAGAVYRAELRRATAELGMTWRPADRRGLSELAGLPRGLLRQFSKRRIEVEEALAERGSRGPKAADAATLVTRRTKVDVEFAEAQHEWRRQAASHGWTAARAEQAVLGNSAHRSAPSPGLDRGRVASKTERARLVEELLGPTGLTRDQAAFRRSDVLRAWAAALPQGASAAELEDLVDHTLARPEIVPLVVADHAGQPWTRGHGVEAGVVRLMVGAAPADALCEERYTTTEMLAVEGRLLSWAVAGKNQGVAQVSATAIETAVAGRALSDEQAAMVAAICGSGDACSVVIGVPGSGKTYGLGVARELWEAGGYEVLGVALAGRAADELGRGAGLHSAQTIDSFLAGAAGRVDERTVIICDEAGMVDTRRLATLAGLAARAGAKLVVVGDDRQLAPVEAGGALLALAARAGAVRLTDNRRQIEAWERAALAALRDGRAVEAAAAYLAHGRVTVADSANELMGLMVADWWATRQAGEDAAMWAYSAEAVSELNARARARLGLAGHLGEAELAVPASLRSRRGKRAFAAGDEIVCLRNRSRLPGDRSGRGVRNGTLAVVLDVEATGLAIRSADGRDLYLPSRYVADWVDHCYAMTVHKTQGRTLGRVQPSEPRRGHAFVYGAAGLSGEAALVAASRATDRTDLYVCSVAPPEPTDHGDPEPMETQQQLERAWSRSEAKATATDLATNLEHIRQLAGLPAGELRRRLADLDRLEPAVGRRLTNALADAEHRLGVAAAVLAESPHGPAGEEAGREGMAALADAAQLRGRLDRRQRLVEQWKGDLRGVDAERETLRQALRTQRRWRQSALAADPPRWLAELLGPTPTAGRARAQLWWEALSAALDIRDSQGLHDRAPNADVVNTSVVERAIGLDPDSPTAARWAGAIATIRETRGILASRDPSIDRRVPGGKRRMQESERLHRLQISRPRSESRHLA